MAASASHLDLRRAPYCYVLYGVEYIGLVPLAPFPGGLGDSPIWCVCVKYIGRVSPALCSTGTGQLNREQIEEHARKLF